MTFVVGALALLIAVVVGALLEDRPKRRNLVGQSMRHEINIDVD